MPDLPVEVARVGAPVGWKIPARRFVLRKQPPPPKPVQRPPRNGPCTCGSGRKAKRCCWI